jgi:hypothetical protein
LVDVFFGLVAASLPVLNVAIPRRWRSTTSSKGDLFPKGAAAIRMENQRASTRFKSDEAVYQSNRTIDRFSEEDSQDDRDGDGSGVHSPHAPPQSTAWTDPGSRKTGPVPTHRERMEEHGRQGDPLV